MARELGKDFTRNFKRFVLKKRELVTETRRVPINRVWDLIQAVSDLFESASVLVDRTGSSADFQIYRHDIFQSEACDVACEGILAQEIVDRTVERWIASPHRSPNLLIVTPDSGSSWDRDRLPGHVEAISYNELAAFLAPRIKTPGSKRIEKRRAARAAKVIAANHPTKGLKIEDARKYIEQRASEYEATFFKGDVSSILSAEGFSISTPKRYPDFIATKGKQRIGVLCLPSGSVGELESISQVWTAARHMGGELWVIVRRHSMDDAVLHGPRTEKHSVYMANAFAFRQFLRHGLAPDEISQEDRERRSEEVKARYAPEKDFQASVKESLKSGGYELTELAFGFPTLRLSKRFGVSVDEVWVTTATHLSERGLDNVLSAWQRRGSNRGDHLWIVAEDITADAARRPLPGDIRLSSFSSLKALLSQGRSVADAPRRSTAAQKKLAITVAADKSSIMAAVMGLDLSLRNRIDELKERRSNNDEDHRLLDEYRTLLSWVEALEGAIRDLDVNKPQRLEEAARGFWTQSGEWIASNHTTIMTSAVQGAFFVSIVGILGLMKVLDPYTTAGALGIATGLSDRVIQAFGKRLREGPKKGRKGD